MGIACWLQAEVVDSVVGRSVAGGSFMWVVSSVRCRLSQGCHRPWCRPCLDLTASDYDVAFGGAMHGMGAP